MPFKTANLLAFLNCGLLAAVGGCGGGSGNNVATLTANCAPTIVSTGDTVQCSAQLPGNSINWTASAGTISPTGQFTAPSTSGAVTITATSASDQTKSAQTTVNVVAVPSSHHIVIVLEENQGYSTVAGNTESWPNLNNLIAAGALATNYYANTHNSIGNYFMLTTGQLLTNDDNSTVVWDVDNIARRMLATKVRFRIYAEGIDWGYTGGNTGPYVVRHNPFALLSDVADPAVAKVVLAPFGQFAVDLTNNALPELSFIVPNVNNDAHSGPLQQADSWLQNNVVNLLAKNAAFQAGGDGMLIVDFDEAAITDLTNGGGQVVAAFWGPIIKQGYRQATTTLYQHESMLRTVMQVLRLPDPPAAAATARSMVEFFVQQ